MSFKKDLLDKYISILLEYLQLVNASATLKSMDHSEKIIQIGLQSILHIFKLSILHTQNVEIAFCYCQKGMFCYLEYIEQMTNTNTMHNLDNIDALLFGYNKTIMELYNSKAAALGRNNGSTSISSLLVKHNDTPANNHLADFFINNESTKQEDATSSEWKIILEYLSKWTKILLWFERTELNYEDRIHLVTQYLKKYALLFTEKSTDMLQVLEIAQHKIRMSNDEYLGILEEYYTNWKKIQKRNNLPSPESISDKCLYITASYTGKTLSEISAEEGNRNLYEIIKF